MRIQIIAIGALALVSAVSNAQEIVKVKASEAPDVALPEYLFTLPAGQWFVADRLWENRASCTADACEAGINSGSLAVSVERAKGNVRIIAGFRGCGAVAFQEVETGVNPGSTGRGDVRHLLKKVIQAAEKSCSAKAPKLPSLDVASLFPAKAG
jgi:hypothetical protein